MVIEDKNKIRPIRKMTQKRLKNIALYYLKRFESSSENLRSVLKRRIDKYAFHEQSFDKSEAYKWIDEIVEDFERLNYVNDERFADFRVKSYINSGKSERYIKGKLKQKGIEESIIETILEEQEYNQIDVALKFAKKKRIGPFRLDETERSEFKQKDMQKLVQAGFDYDVVLDVLEHELGG